MPQGVPDIFDLLYVHRCCDGKIEKEHSIIAQYLNLFIAPLTSVGTKEVKVSHTGSRRLWQVQVQALIHIDSLPTPTGEWQTHHNNMQEVIRPQGEKGEGR